MDNNEQVVEETNTENVEVNNIEKKDNKKCIIIAVIGAILIVAGLIFFFLNNNKKEDQKEEEKKEEVLKELPPPEVTGGERGQLGIDKNINESNIDEYLNRSDSVYRDMRMLEDPASYESIGGDRFLSGYIRGFEIVPLPYLIPVTGLPEVVGNTYSGKTLFSIDENGNYIPNYEESLSIIERLFPKDKVIFLMCGGGGYAGMTKGFLVSLGWDANKIYNTGGYWYYDGSNNLDVLKTENGYDFSGVPYHEIDFDTLTPISNEKPVPPVEPTPEPTDTIPYLDDKYYNNKDGNGIEKLDLMKYKDELTAKAGTPDYKEIEQKAEDAANQYANQINQMLNNKESFVISVFPSDLCYADTGGEASLLNNMRTLAENNNLYYYNIGLWIYKKTDLYKRVKYAPTVIIVIKGEVKAYIDAENDDHIKYSNSPDEFTKWFESNVHVKSKD